MKTTMKRMYLYLTAVAVLFAACTKDPVEPTPEPEPEPDPVPELAGSSWECQITNTYMYQGMIEMNLDIFNTLDFTSTTEGEFFVDYNMEVPAMPSANQTQNETTAFTYTFDGTTLTMTSTEEGAEAGDVGVMTYNPADTTFIMEIPDETYEGINIREVYGTDKMVFHKVL